MIILFKVHQLENTPPSFECQWFRRVCRGKTILRDLVLLFYLSRCICNFHSEPHDCMKCAIRRSLHLWIWPLAREKRRQCVCVFCLCVFCSLCCTERSFWVFLSGGGSPHHWPAALCAFTKAWMKMAKWGGGSSSLSFQSIQKPFSAILFVLAWLANILPVCTVVEMCVLVCGFVNWM